MTNLLRALLIAGTVFLAIFGVTTKVNADNTKVETRTNGTFTLTATITADGPSFSYTGSCESQGQDFEVKTSGMGDHDWSDGNVVTAKVWCQNKHFRSITTCRLEITVRRDPSIPWPTQPITPWPTMTTCEGCTPTPPPATATPTTPATATPTTPATATPTTPATATPTTPATATSTPTTVCEDGWFINPITGECVPNQPVPKPWVELTTTDFCPVNGWFSSNIIESNKEGITTKVTITNLTTGQVFFTWNEESGTTLIYPVLEFKAGQEAFRVATTVRNDAGQTMTQTEDFWNQNGEVCSTETQSTVTPLPDEQPSPTPIPTIPGTAGKSTNDSGWMLYLGGAFIAAAIGYSLFGRKTN